MIIVQGEACTYLFFWHGLQGLFHCIHWLSVLTELQTLRFSLSELPKNTGSYYSVMVYSILLVLQPKKKNLSGNINLRAFNNQVLVHMLYVTHTKFDEDSIKLYGCHGKFYAISETKDHADMQCLKHEQKW